MSEESKKTPKKRLEKVKEYCYNNRENILKKREKKRKNTEYKDYQNNYHKKYHKGKGREKFLARMETYNRNEKTGICFDCKKQIKTEFHHLSYEPNTFIELCKECHLKRHG